jgi:hypothetical protein
MISDTLADAVADLDRYLQSPLMRETYPPEALAATQRVRDTMDTLRTVLDGLNADPGAFERAVEFQPSAAQIAWAMCWAGPAKVEVHSGFAKSGHPITLETTLERGMSTEAFAKMVRGLVSCAQKIDAESLYPSAADLLAKIEGTKGQQLFGRG